MNSEKNGNMQQLSFKRLFIMIGLVISGPVNSHAYFHEFRPNPGDLFDLDHTRAYTWGIEWELPQQEKIVSASLFIAHIRNSDKKPNDLWIQLLDSARPGVTIHRDNEARGNYFERRQGVEIQHYKNLSTKARDIEYFFDSRELNFVTDYLGDRNFGLGFDPDCRYYNRGITLRIETIHNPIPPSAFLFPTGLVALAAVYRLRKRNSP